MNKEKILITAALPYANGPIHLGHLAGAYLPADMYAQYHRLKGNNVLFICGSDEHGVPITITAEKEKVTPQVVIDRFHEINHSSFRQFGMSFDIYSRTSIPRHHETAKEFFLNFYERKILNEQKTMQFYDEKAGMFLPDRYVEGTCPKCGNEAARSDECERCGSLYDASELINPVSKITGERPVLKETSHWYFPLGNYQEALEKYIKKMDDKYGWKENVLQYCKGWFHDGLKDRAVTRDLDWGVPVPLKSAAGKVLYVWFEAVLGYISASKEYSAQQGKPELWREYWQEKDSKYVAFIGKDNVVFHCIVFPAMLMAWNAGNNEQYVLPQNVPANEFLNFEGQKFSKSRGWGIDVIDFLKLFNADSLRYSLSANAPELRDTDFSWKEFQARHNNELANILGNFVNRTMTFAHKNFEGKVPPLFNLNERDSEMLNVLETYPAKIAELYEHYRFKDAVLETMNLARIANKYFNDSEPWKSIKSDREECSTTINICIQIIYTLAELFTPILPYTSEKIFDLLNAGPTDWDSCGRYPLSEGHQIKPAEVIFKKIEDDEIDKAMAASTGKTEEPIVPATPQIAIEDFQKIELKAGVIIAAERPPKSAKLLKLKVSLGTEVRQVMAGIGQSYTPEEVLHKRVLIVANLKPAKLMGIESQGMLLAGTGPDGKLYIVSPDDAIPAGTIIK